jgi:hypothetical protein
MKRAYFNRKSFCAIGGMGFILLALVGCNLGTDPKTLGNKSKVTPPPASRDSDSFSIFLAYRKDVNPDNGRLVVVQGNRTLNTQNFVNLCGTQGSSCACDFYKNASDTAPRAALTSVGFSQTYNSFSCTMGPNIANPDEYTRVRIRTTDGKFSSGFVEIKTTLTLDDVLMGLDKKGIRGIYRYTCNTVFLEGEGVSSNGVECPVAPAVPAGQRLGLISYPRDYYVFKSQLENNFNLKTADEPYEGNICDKQLNRYICASSTPDLRFGFYFEADPTKRGPFQTSIQLAPNPTGAGGGGSGNNQQSATTDGFVALPDSQGNCPTGLLKVRPFTAQPQSIIEGSLGGNPPSSFVNISNRLNNTILESNSMNADGKMVDSNGTIVTLDVNRQPNVTPCRSDTGSCAAATFGGVTVVQQNSYSGFTPVVCVIPKELLTGLF